MLIYIAGLFLYGQEVNVSTSHPVSVSPVERAYSGNCEDHSFEISFHRTIAPGTQQDFRLYIRRNEVEVDLTGSQIYRDLAQGGLFLNSGIACSSDGSLTWYLWAIKLEPEGGPRYLRGTARVNVLGEIVSYTGLQDNELGYEYIARVNAY